jgi:hypothetical protein
MKDNYDVLTMDSKEKRDEIFQQMRTSADPLERKSTKFSGNRLKEDGTYISTWSVATPRD